MPVCVCVWTRRCVRRPSEEPVGRKVPVLGAGAVCVDWEGSGSTAYGPQLDTPPQDASATVSGGMGPPPAQL